MNAPDTDHGHAHHHGTGIPWLDIIVGVSAMFISVVSLIVSIQHGKTMEKMVDQNEKMVAANTMPFLTQYGSAFDPATMKLSPRLSVKNAGVGPAVIDWFVVSYDGKVQSNLKSLLASCCSEALPTGSGSGAIYSNISGTVLPPRETLDIFEIPPAASPELKASVLTAGDKLSFQACYCSVLDECWITDFKAARPQPVRACPARKHEELW